MALNDTGVQIKSERFKDKRIAVAVCGGIGAVEVVKIIRELRRHGATVTAFMTPSSLRFVGKDAVSWATQKAAIVEASHEVEYLDPFDLLLVVPATLHTISKAALALTDNVVSLLIASHLGNRGKTLFVPAMNLAMKQHPRYDEYRGLLRQWGVEFLESTDDEDRMKVPEPHAIVEKVSTLL